MSEQHLQLENERLKQEVVRLKALLDQVQASKSNARSTNLSSDQSQSDADDKDKCLSIVVIGASGDLAFKKIYPCLFSLYSQGYFPAKTLIAGYARSKIAQEDFLKRISQKFDRSKQSQFQSFFDINFYVNGQYDQTEDFGRLHADLYEREQQMSPAGANRVFYFAIPPSVFVQVSKSIHSASFTKSGWNRIIVEKPFGRDLDSSNQLQKELGSLFSEDQVYRIDHYLGKEMVQNLMVLRFANKVFEPIWNRDHISSVQITFKEDFGTEGRGGYFDQYGIIRDVMQNHLLQILSLIGMEPPVSMRAEDVRDEKVKLLRAISPIELQDIVIGQYGPGEDPVKQPGYLDDPTVDKSSITPTFAAAVLKVNNSRWADTPFILKCGKALNQRKAEIRIQFKTPVNNLFEDLSPNELVMRVQPDEAVYLKMTTKKPGLESGLSHTELDLSYKKRFKHQAQQLPDAYERLILDVIQGDHNLFVRVDELQQAWNIFTPILHRLENERIRPINYSYGSRGPTEADQLIERIGYVRTVKYEWQDPHQEHENKSKL